MPPVTSRTDERHRFRLNPTQRRRFLDKTHTLLTDVGAYSSGKSFLNALILLDRSAWDTGQRHGFFAQTETQALEGVGATLEKVFDLANIKYTYGSMAPPAWRARWEREGTPYPNSGLRNRSTFITENGLHACIGGLSGGKHKRWKGFEFGSVCVDEVTECLSREPLDFIIARCRCGDFAGGFCRQFHRHQVHLTGNPPPPASPHWIRGYLRDLEEREQKRRAEGLPPFFVRFQSRTDENVAHVGEDYAALIAASLDEQTAHAMLTGDLSQVFASRAYRTFTAANVAPIPYDPHRTVMLALDFNVSPATATLSHVLREDEVPHVNRVRDSDHEPVGVFGEFYFEGGMDASSVALALVEGDHKGLSVPSNFTGLRNHLARVYAYGDATGGMRRVESPGLRSAWHYVNSVMTENLGKRYEVMVGKSNPGVIESVETVISMLQASNGDRTLFVDPRCKHVVRDMEEQRWKDDVPELHDGDGTIGHLMDGVRYLCSKRYPNRGRAAVRAQARPMVADPYDRMPGIGKGR